MKLTFLGADRIVTGSCHMLEVNGKKVLFDCGMFQGSKLVKSFNNRPFAFNPADIDAVVLSHAHVDHSGLIPRLVKQGFRGNVYCTKVTEELCEILLPDCGHIQESEAEFANRKGMRAGLPVVEPLYTVDEAYAALKHFVTKPYNQDFEIFPGISIRFRVAGHIIGSAIVNILVKENGKETKIIFSGDLGQPNQPIIQDPYQISGADFIITESTYGNRTHEVGDREEELCEIMKEALAKGGNVVIPAFAVGRTQTLLYYFQKMMAEKKLPTVPIVVDSPMAINATKVVLINPKEFDEEATTIYKEQGGHLLDMPNVKYTQTPEESKAINDMPSPLIIISASGMADAGRVLHHLKHNLWRADCSVIFAGYQAEGSMGRRLIDGIKKVKIMGEDIAVRAKIYNMKGFSAHADKDQMMDLYSHMKKKPKAFFVVHGELDAAMSFATDLKNNIGTATLVPGYGDSVTIDGTDWKVEQSTIGSDIPEVQEFRDDLSGLDKSFVQFRTKMEQTILHDSGKLGTVKSKLERLKSLMEDLLKN